MLFNSIDFAVFLVVVFILYWYVINKNLKYQNLLILVASYTFYGWWDLRFLLLIMFSTLVDFLVGYGLGKAENQIKRKVLLWTSITVNIGLLGFFKYYDFFLDSFASGFNIIGQDIDIASLELVLPVGISFYTFQTLSYTIDVYKRQLEPTKDIIAFSAFVGFFPQLVAGPIERASSLLPQIKKMRTFDITQFKEGILLIIYGFFLKIFIADTLAPAVNRIFASYETVPGGTLILGAIFFSFQVYGDFAGYSKIARGTAKLFGFELMLNFDFPFFSRNIAELWRRWHISLNTWFRDYLYIPLGGSRRGKFRAIVNIFIIFTVSGFWHGPNWTFIVWGAVHGLLFIPIFLSKNKRTYSKPFSFDKFSRENFRQLFGIITTFSIFAFSLIFFRSESIQQASVYVSRLNFDFSVGLSYLTIVFICVVVDIFVLRSQYKRYVYPVLIGATIAAAISNVPTEFLYFKF
jgi:D-alanyl-lipoteichoic acid acyltransferase DltB (MBOAT superfamily)